MTEPECTVRILTFLTTAGCLPGPQASLLNLPFRRRANGGGRIPDLKFPALLTDRLTVSLSVAALFGSVAVLAAPGPAQAADLQVSIPGLGVSDGVITAYAWPNGETLDALPADSEVPMLPLKLVPQSTTGKFQVGSTVPAGYREGDGSMNLEVEATTDVGTATLAVATAADALSLPTDGSTLLMTGAAVDAGIVPAKPVPPPCITKKTAEHQTPKEAYVQANGAITAPARVMEKTKTTQELGISVSIDGGKTFKASGEASVTHKAEKQNVDTTAPRATAQLWKNQVNYYKFVKTCNKKVKSVTWRPTVIYSLNVDFDVVPHPVYKYCAEKPTGNSWSKSTGITNTFSTGVGLTPVKVSATAEWGKDVEVSWTSTEKTWYCGTNPDGPETSALVEVHTQ